MGRPQPGPDEKSFEDQLLGLREGKLAAMSKTLGLSAPKFKPALGVGEEDPTHTTMKMAERLDKLRTGVVGAVKDILTKLQKSGRFENPDNIARYFAGEVLDSVFPGVEVHDSSRVNPMTVIFRELVNEVSVLFEREEIRKEEREKAKARAAAQVEPPVRKKGKRK